MLVNLASTSAASAFAASPRPGVTGVLPVANGGTGNTSVDTTPTSGSTKMVTSGGVYTALSGKSATGHKHAAGDITSGTLPIARGGTGVTSLDALATALGTGKVAAVSYDATGVFGESNPNSVTFPFAPKYAFMYGRCQTYNGTWAQFSTSTAGCAVNFDFATTTYTERFGFKESSSALVHGKVSSDGKTISWYSTTASYQCNESGWRYTIIAIG